MLRALIKKQFLELNTYYFQDRKTGKHRSRAGTIGFVTLFVFLFLMIAAMFFFVSEGLAAVLLPANLAWLYFSMMGLVAICLGTFGDVFNTYATLYHAKDNELLLSMPVPPAKILFVRMMGAYAMGLLYESLVFVPAVIVFWLRAELTVCNVLFPILLLFIIAFFVLTLTCVLGWVVALISARLKNKSIITVILSLVFIGLYYFVYFRINALLQSVVANIDRIGETIRSALYPFYHMGLAASGNAVSMLIFTVFVAALFALAYYILSRSFIRIVTMNRGGKKTVYRERAAKVANIKGALLRKELKRFTSCPTYLLNSGLGVIILLAAAVFGLIRMNWLRELLDNALINAPMLAGLIPAAITAVLCLIVSMDAVSAPSISLEGKNLWLLQSMPVAPWDALHAKERLHVLLNAVPSILTAVIYGIVAGAAPLTIVLMAAAVWLFVWFSAAFGLVLGLKKPNLKWTNEAVPIKQSMSVMVALFGGWAISIGFGAACFFLGNAVGEEVCLLGFAVLLGVLVLLLNGWLKKRGAKIFAAL